MALLLKRLFETFDYAMRDFSDERSAKWPLMRSPVQVPFIIVVYLYFVHVYGPKFMKDRKPYDLKNIIVGYNVLQIFLNLSIVIGFLPHVWTTSWVCSEISYTYDYIPMITAKAGYFYFLVKIVDLLDTVFFVLKKKDKQITFLHVYHHAGMIFLGWIGVKYINGGHTVFLPFVNGIVHVVMYSYYLITSYSKNVNVIWWKKHITQMQLFQFVMLLMWYMFPLFSSECKYSKLLIMCMIPQNLAMTVLFGEFYYRTYVKKKVS